MTYDSGGRMLTDAATTLPLGVDATVRRIERAYDDMGRQVLLTSYDASSGGNIVNEVASAYGGWGNVVAEWQSHDGPVTEFTPVVEYVFEDGATGGEARYVRFAAVIYPDRKVLEYVRDPVPGRIRVIVLDGITNAVYWYRGLNAVTGHDFPVTDGAMSKILTIDRFARVADLSWQHDDSTLVEQFQYAYDRGSRRTARLQLLDAAWSESYLYDRFHQLVDMQRQRGDAQVWDLEHAGNWAQFQDNSKSQSREHNAVNELTAIDGVTQSVEHDAAGNMTRIPKQAPWNKYYTCIWDAWNRLVEVFEGANLAVRSGYDGNSRRIWKYDGHEIRDFYYDGWNVLEDIASRPSGVTTNAYCWGIDLSGSLQGAGGIGGLLSRTEDVSLPVFYYSDANGNVAKIVDITGTNVLAEYQYDPYGTPIRAVGPEASANPYRFSSKYVDDETELLCYGYRFYSPWLGRWTARDPIGEAGNIGLYRFVGNAPTHEIDLLGALTLKCANQISGIVELKDDLKVTCPGTGKSVGIVKVKVALDAHPRQKSSSLIGILEQYARLWGLNVDPNIRNDDFIGAFVKLEFIPNSQALEKCCGPCEPDKPPAGWVQYYDSYTPNSTANLDQVPPPAKGVPTPFFTRTPRTTLVDFAGIRDSELRKHRRTSWGVKFWDELRCAKKRDGADAKLPSSYTPLLKIEGDSTFKWAYHTRIGGMKKSPTAKAIMWYNEHPRGWPPPPYPPASAFTCR